LDGKDKYNFISSWLDLLLDEKLREGKLITLPVLTGSMHPFLIPGKKVVVRYTSWEKCHVGDIILFRQDKELTAHRLLFRFKWGTSGILLQKGDSNALGSFIRPYQVVGKVIRAELREKGYYDFDDLRNRQRARKLAAKHFRKHIAWYVFKGVRQIKRILFKGK
jgi:hypothetical protein